MFEDKHERKISLSIDARMKIPWPVPDDKFILIQLNDNLTQIARIGKNLSSVVVCDIQAHLIMLNKLNLNDDDK